MRAFRLSSLRTALGSVLVAAAAAQGGGVTLVRDLNPGPGDGFTPVIAMLGDVAFFAGNDGVLGQELWLTDGTAAGTRLVLDINPGGAGSVPRGLVACNGVLLFSADDGVHARELWRSDGTAAGTRMVKDISSFPLGSVIDPMVAVGGTVCFGGNDPVTGTELWKSDGTEAGTVLVKDIARQPSPSQSSQPSQFLVLGSTLLFTADDHAAFGRELWKSDGTEAGTVLVKDIHPGPSTSTSPFPLPMVVLGARVHFAATDGTHGFELWTSDGTTAGTAMVIDLNPGQASALALSLLTPGAMRAFGGILLFAADDGVSGIEPWHSDGTAAGTQRLSDIAPGIAASTPHQFVVAHDTAFFVANDGVHGAELWATDGTTSGTRLVLDANIGSASGLGLGAQMAACGSGRRVVFAADDGSSGVEPWQSDGTATGTLRITDLCPGTTGANPVLFARLRARMLFGANDGAHGTELFALPLAAVGATLVERHGTGCPGTAARVPRVTWTGLPQLGAGGFGVGVADARPAASAVLAASAQRAALPLDGGCTWLVQAPPVALLLQTTGAGTAFYPVPIPNDPALLGGECAFQFGILDPNGAFGGVACFSDGLFVVAGR